MTEFKPGDRIRVVGGNGTDMVFVAQFGDTVYATTGKPGFGNDAHAYTDNEWEKVPKFFEKSKTYKYVDGEFTYAVHRVFEMEGKRYAAAISSWGSPILFDADDFDNMEEV